MTTIPFNKPHLGGKALWYIAQAHANGQLAGDGSFTKRCQSWLEIRAGLRLPFLVCIVKSAL